MMDTTHLLERARKDASSSTTTAIAGNTVVLATMFSLYRMLEDRIATQTASLADILAISNSIANLSSSINTSVTF